MYIAMNRFKIVLGKEKEFEDVWKNRDTHLDDVQGFKNFNLIKGDTNKEYSLYSSHSTWESKESFINWGKSAQPITIVDPRNRKLAIFMLEDIEK